MVDFPSYSLTDKIDHDILMHKDAHFSGSFPLMIDYYENNGKGVIEEFALERILELFHIEQENKTFLSEEILTDDEKKEVIQAKIKYDSLKKVYDLPPGPAHKVADLIFSEDFEASEEIESLLGYPDSIPLLIQLIKDDNFYNPLFPGYGFAPLHAIEALGLLKAKEAIIPLFESLSKTEFFGEESTIYSLFQIGAPAKEFLLEALQTLPISKDNENAAIALLPFKEDPIVPSTCLKLLELPEVQAKPMFFTYLLLTCEDLQNIDEQKKLIEISKLPHLTKENKEELDWIISHFKMQTGLKSK